MRKTNTCIFIVISAVVFMFFSCNSETHTHTFNNGWTFDESFHWHDATCGHNIVSGKGSHTWDNGVEKTPATHTLDGEMIYTCTVCGCTNTEVIPARINDHPFSPNWSYDETQHWHAILCEHDIAPEKDSHTINEYGRCSVCGFREEETIEGNFKVSASGALNVIDPLLVSGDITIPNTVGGKSVTSIAADSFSDCTLMTSVLIPSSVTYIGDCAFRGCTSLAGICIPEGVNSVGEKAFYGCSSLKEVTIPTTAVWFGEEVFFNCPCSVIFTDGIKRIPMHALYMANLVTSVSIPDSVTSIDTEAFTLCYSLTSISIPSTVSSIGDDAFNGCSSLTELILPESLKYIGSYAFSDCTGLEGITIPSGVNTIRQTPFAGWSSDQTVVVKGSEFSSINGYPIWYNCQAVVIADIKESTEIASKAFFRCSTLISVKIPSSVSSIGSESFDNCKSLTSITIPSSVTQIEDKAFCYCTGLSDIYYTGTINQWNEIDKGLNWNIDVPAIVVHCNDGDVAI